MNPSHRTSQGAGSIARLQIRQRVIGLVFAGLGLVMEYEFVKAILYGGEFGLIKTLLAPLLVSSGLLLLFRPDWYGSISRIDASGNTRAQLVVGLLWLLGAAINGGLYAYVTWLH